MDDMCCMCVANVLQENVLVKNLNISLAFFINSCLSLMDRSFIFQLIQLYCKAVSHRLIAVAVILLMTYCSEVVSVHSVAFFFP